MSATQHHINPDIPNFAFIASNQDTNNRTPWQFQRAFKGMCNRCGAQRHKGADCPNLKAEAQNTSNLQTTNQKYNVNTDPFQPKGESCGRAHQTYNCYNLEVNKANRPVWWTVPVRFKDLDQSKCTKQALSNNQTQAQHDNQSTNNMQSLEMANYSPNDLIPVVLIVKALVTMAGHVQEW